MNLRRASGCDTASGYFRERDTTRGEHPASQWFPEEEWMSVTALLMNPQKTRASCRTHARNLLSEVLFLALCESRRIYRFLERCFSVLALLDNNKLLEQDCCANPNAHCVHHCGCVDETLWNIQVGVIVSAVFRAAGLLAFVAHLVLVRKSVPSRCQKFPPSAQRRRR